MVSKDSDKSWHDVTAFESDKCRIPESLEKGDNLRVKGHIDVVKYTNVNGETQTTYRIVATSLEKIEKPGRLRMEE